MLIHAKPMESYEINARDGMIGKVKDLYFDDQKWAVRYVVVDTGAGLDDVTIAAIETACDVVFVSSTDVPSVQ